MVVVDVGESVVFIVALFAAGPAGAVEVAEKTSIIWIPANAVGVYLIFDSGVVKDFNRTAWGLRK